MQQINATPERNQEFELDLNFITTNESHMNRADFEIYAKHAFYFLKNKKKCMTEEDIKKRYNPKNMKDFLNSSAFFKQTIQKKNKKGVFVDRYVDIAESYYVQPEDSSCDLFFAYKLRQLALLDIDLFLDYQIFFYYNNDVSKFKRFLEVCLRAHKKLITPETEITVTEWIEAKEKQISQIENEQLGQVKGRKRPARTNNDNKTILTQEQTVLLAHYLQNENVFYNGYINDTDIGIAFEILTGFSRDSIRTKVSASSIDKCKTYQNIEELHKLVKDLAKKIAKDLPQIKK